MNYIDKKLVHITYNEILVIITGKSITSNLNNKIFYIYRIF